MGSGKTTIQRLLKRLVDPTAPETVRFDPRDFLQKASHAYLVMLDNQNTIPEWGSRYLMPSGHGRGGLQEEALHRR